MFVAVHPAADERSTGSTAPGGGPVTGGVQHDAGLGQLFNLAQEMLCVAGFDGRLKQVNPAWQRTLGWTDAELTSRPYEEFLHPDNRGPIPDPTGVLPGGQHIVHFENRFRIRDGSYRWLSWVATPNRDDGLIYAAAHDITAAKHEAHVKAAQEAVTRIAADSTDWDEAAWQILKGVCTALGWEMAALWIVDRSEQQLVWKHAYFASDEVRDL